MSNINQIYNKIREIVGTREGDSFDDAYNIYKIIVGNAENFDEQVKAFQYACEIYGTLELDKSCLLEQAPYKNEKNDLKAIYGEIVNSLLLTYFKKNCQEEEFYTSIWSIISESLIFVDEKSKVFALYYVLIDARIPYFRLNYDNKYSLSNEKYKDLRIKYIRDRQRMRFILKTSFNQKTEKASTLLAELGINIPCENATVEEIETYERKLMQMVEILPEKNIDEAVINELARRIGR